jgi:uncharacterized protein (DUF305 family)
VLFGSTGALAAASEEHFQAAMQEAMVRMHRDMSAGPSGDVDRDFAAMMIPHHQGGVEMAVLELRHGTDERLRRLAHGIIVEQEQEIRLMRQVLTELKRTPGGKVEAAIDQAHRHGEHR